MKTTILLLLLIFGGLAYASPDAVAASVPDGGNQTNLVVADQAPVTAPAKISFWGYAWRALKIAALFIVAWGFALVGIKFFLYEIFSREPGKRARVIIFIVTFIMAGIFIVEFHGLLV